MNEVYACRKVRFLSQLGGLSWLRNRTDWGLVSFWGEARAQYFYYIIWLQVEQLVASIRDVKSAGNCHFGEGRYKAAIRKYRKCLRYLEHAFYKIEEVKDPDTKEQCEFLSIK